MPNTGVAEKSLLDQRRSLRKQMRSMVEAKYAAAEMEAAADGSVLVPDFTAEETEQHTALVAAWDRVEDSLRMLDSDKERDRIGNEAADLVAGAGSAGEDRLRANVQAYENLIAVGRNQFSAERVPEKGHPGEWELPAPAILRGSDGKNRVHPFPAVFGREPGRPVDVEASFRNAEMIRAGRHGEFDPLTGRRLEAAPATDPIRQVDVPGSIPDLVVDLYRYMIDRNMLAQYCTIYQTPGLNDLPITRRTEVPKATIVGDNTNYGENTDIGDQQSVFSSFTLKAFKYAFISQYSYEAAMSVEPWSIAAQVVEDGGIGLANGFGEHVWAGTGGTAQPTGILTAIKADSSQQVAGPAAATAFTGARNARTFTIDTFTNFLTNLNIEYFRSPNLRLIVGLAAWGNLLSVTDTNGQPIFNADMSVREMSLPKFGLMVELEPAAETVAAGNYPFVIADLSCHAVRYAGGVRIDFSTEYGWQKDLLSYKFVSYGDANQIDPNGSRGLLFS